MTSKIIILLKKRRSQVMSPIGDLINGKKDFLYLFIDQRTKIELTKKAPQTGCFNIENKLQRFFMKLFKAKQCCKTTDNQYHTCQHSNIKQVYNGGAISQNSSKNGNPHNA